MKQKLVEKIKQAIYEWAKQYPQVELAEIDVYPSPSGVPDVFHVIVVAAKGFESWDQADREDDLYWFLQKQLDDSNDIGISLLLTLTEEESDKYEQVTY